MRTPGEGGGVNEKRTGAYKGVRVGGGEEGGSEIGDFTAYVLYGCPLILAAKFGDDPLVKTIHAKLQI